MIEKNLGKIFEKKFNKCLTRATKIYEGCLESQNWRKISNNCLPGPCKAIGIVGTTAGIALVGQK